MKEIVINYVELGREYVRAKAEIEKEAGIQEGRIAALEAKLERAKKKLKKIESKEDDLNRPSTYQHLIKPLAEKMSQHFGMGYEIYGPFGVECETSIYLRKDDSKSICDQPTISITLRPGNCQTKLMYNTGEKTNRYPKGSFGELNGLNDVYAPLPMEFEEILKLVTNDFEQEE